MIGKYSKILIDHFTSPRNIGILDNYSVKVEGTNESDGDRVLFFISVEDDIVKDIKFKIKGCPRAIASCSFASEMVMGKNISEIMQIDSDLIYQQLEVDKIFECIPMGIETIKKGLKLI